MAGGSTTSSIFEDLTTCLPKIRVPSLGDKVHKEECCLSFDTPESKDGLYVCLTTFLAFGRSYVDFYHEVTHNRVFLHLRRIKKQVNKSTKPNQSPSEKKPKRLAIGIEGGFQPDQEEKVEYDEVNKLIILPQFHEISLDSIEEIPSIILASISAVLSSTSAHKKEEVLAWDGEVKPVTKYAETLLQLDNGIKIPPIGWKCARCDLASNLWLNLTDGMILCGRRYFDDTGGNNHGVEHYKETGYPLAVKLGTITPSGADVYSYEEDSMVQDPRLAEHLTHFGINMLNMEKTEQTMTELEIELNEKLGSEWNIIQEAGKNLKELQGPGLIGLVNMGNSCYLNSTVQVLMSISEFQQRFSNAEQCLELFRRRLAPLSWDLSNPSTGFSLYAANPAHNNAMISKELQKRALDFSGDFTLQMCKLGLALHLPASKSIERQDQATKFPPVTPRSLKHVIGHGHPEFSTNRQQDAHEFFLHLLSTIERNDRKEGLSCLADCFKFMVEERVECLQSKQVRYTKRCEYVLSLPVPIDMATNKAAVDVYLEKKKSNPTEEIVRAAVSFQSCINAFMEDEKLLDFWSSALKEKSDAAKRSRLSTFPDYLVVQLKKFTVGSDWIPKKLDVSVNVPDTLDLSRYRGSGVQKDEVLLPDVSPPSQKSPAPTMEVDEEAVAAIAQMGFPLDRCRAAIIATGNMGAEPAIMWLMENPDAEVPVSSLSGPPDSLVGSIVDMGFTREQAIKALKATNNNLERAADWIFSHLDELDSIDAPEPPSLSAGEGDVAMETGIPAQGVRDGPGIYELFAFISHMGTSTLCGHYVCHVKKNGRWVIFNDEKVAESETPPRDLAYIYFYRRNAE